MKYKYITWLPAVIIMLVIFSFSHKPANNSNESSLTIAGKALAIYEKIANTSIDTEKRPMLLEKINHIVRKGAHFSEYALLSFALAFHFFTCKWKKLRVLSFSIIGSSLYAMTDEYHQTFIEGRSGQISDVLLDTSGALTGALFFTLFISIINSFSQRKAKSRI